MIPEIDGQSSARDDDQFEKTVEQYGPPSYWLRKFYEITESPDGFGQKLKELISKRAEQLADATIRTKHSGAWGWGFDDWEIKEKSVKILLKENINYDCPSSVYITLTAEDLNLSEADWNKKIEVEKQKSERIYAENENKKHERELELARIKLRELEKKALKNAKH